MAKHKENITPETVEDELVELVKDGESVFAHPTQVPHWKSQGWTEAPEAE